MDLLDKLDEFLGFISPVAEWLVLLGFDSFAQATVYTRFDVFYPLSLIASYGFCIGILQPAVVEQVSGWKHYEWAYHIQDNIVPLPAGFFRACLLWIYGSKTFFKDMFIGASAAYAAYATREFVNYKYPIEENKVSINANGDIHRK